MKIVIVFLLIYQINNSGFVSNIYVLLCTHSKSPVLVFNLKNIVCYLFFVGQWAIITIQVLAAKLIRLKGQMRSTA